MAPGVAFNVGALPQFLAVAGMVSLGVLLLVLHFESRFNRVFSLFLILRGFSMLSATQWQLTRYSDPTTSAFWVQIFPYFTIATPLVLAYFVWIYPRPRRRVEPDWLPAALVAGAVVVLEAIYVIEPSLWGSYAVSSEGVLTTVDQGPMIALLGLMFLMFALAGLVFAWDAKDIPPGPHRRSLLLVSLAFTVNALFDGTSTTLLVLGVTPFAEAGLPQYMGAISLVPALAAPAVLVAAAIRGESDDLRGDAVRYSAACALAIAVAFGTIFASGLDVFLVATGVLRLALPTLVAYALLRHQLFDIDLKVRWGIEQGTVGAIFAAAFVFASEVLEEFIPVDGPVLGIVAAGLLALALRPIQRVAHRMAVQVVSGSEPIESLDEEQGLDLYRQQARIVWSDDQVTSKERAALDNLREELGIDGSRAERIEAEVAGV